MKKLLSLFGTILVTFTFLFPLIIPLSVGATSSDSTIPNSIDGLPVIYIKTSENTVGLPEDQKILVLLDKTIITIEESDIHQKLTNYFNKNPLPKGWTIEVFGGTNASVEELRRSIRTIMIG